MIFSESALSLKISLEIDFSRYIPFYKEYLTRMSNIYTLPSLVHTRKDGKTHKWSVWAQKNQVFNQDHIIGGKVKDATIKTCTGTNIGKKNERSPSEQAVEEARSRWIKCLDKGYAPAFEDVVGTALYKQVMNLREKSGFKNRDIMSIICDEKNVSLSAGNNNDPQFSLQIRPMLASKWNKKTEFKNGAYIQPKADGIRALARFFNGAVVITSRTGKEFSHFSHIKEGLLPFFKGHSDIILDGELYIHELQAVSGGELVRSVPGFSSEGGESLDKTRRWNVITSMCSSNRKTPHEDEILIKYYLFDVCDKTGSLTQEERFNILNKSKIKSPHVIKLPTRLIDSTDEIDDALEEWVSEGYEGVIIRDKSLKYLQGPARSRHLLKYKLQDTDEFVISGAKEGNGTEKGCIVWVCKTDEGKTFSCRPSGTHAERKKLMQNSRLYIGKELTVRYQGKDPRTNIPRFPVGIQVGRWDNE